MQVPWKGVRSVFVWKGSLWWRRQCVWGVEVRVKASLGGGGIEAKEEWGRMESSPLSAVPKRLVGVWN